MAAVINISIDQGSHFEHLFELQGTAQIDLEAATPHASMKREYDSTEDPVAFTATMAGPDITISMPWTQTKDLTPGIWVYDVIVVDEVNVVTRVVQGRCTVTPQVTTPA